MTDYNDNKINLDDQEESTPNGSNSQPAVPTEGDAPAGNKTLPADRLETNQTVAVVGELPGSNPFTEMVGEVPLEAALRELAAQNSGVQITETYQIYTDTPAGCSLAAPAGSPKSQDLLVCIGMSVQVTRMIEATGVPTRKAYTTDEGGTPTQTVVTHQDAQGVIIDVLDNLPGKDLPGPPGVVETNNLYEINTDFAADLLKDGGEEALTQLMETYHPASGSLLDIPALELDFNEFELDETGSGPETRSGPEEESGEPAIGTAAAESATPPNAAEARATKAGVESSSRRPSPPEEGDETRIPDVGLFRRESGQPVWLRAYPYVRPKLAPPSRKRPQAYREQDHYNPVWTYMRDT